MSLTSSAIIPNPWVRILDALEKKVNRHSYDTWLKPTRYSHASNKILFVRVPTAEFQHVGDKYADLIQEAVDNLGLGYEEVKFVTAADEPSNTPIRHNAVAADPTMGTHARAALCHAQERVVRGSPGPLRQPRVREA